MLLYLNNTSIEMNTIAAYTLFSIYGHKSTESKGPRYMCQRSIIAQSADIYISRNFLFINAVCVSPKKLFAAFITRNVISDELRNADFTNSIFVP